jgi:very-short-patch-repair endonuclease
VPAGIDVHRTTRLAATEVTVHAGIPVTTAARTLADLAAVLRHRELERALERAETMQLLDVRALLVSVRNRPGAAQVRRVLAAWEPSRTKSELEVTLLKLVRGSPLPVPEVNAQVAALEVDLLWRHERVVAEADSLQFHLSRAAMERDRRRDAVLTAQGFRVLRFTSRQVNHRPNEVIAALRAVLGDHAA